METFPVQVSEAFNWENNWWWSNTNQIGGCNECSPSSDRFILDQARGAPRSYSAHRDIDQQASNPPLLRKELTNGMAHNHIFGNSVIPSAGSHPNRHHNRFHRFIKVVGWTLEKRSRCWGKPDLENWQCWLLGDKQLPRWKTRRLQGLPKPRSALLAGFPR